MGGLDGRAVHVRRHLRPAPAPVVDPELQHVRRLTREVGDVPGRLLGGRRLPDHVRREGGASVRQAGRRRDDARPAGEQDRERLVAEPAGALLVSERDLRAVPVGAERLHGAHPVVDRSPEVVQHVVTAVVSGVGRGATHVPDVAVDVDERGHDRPPGEVDHGRSVRNVDRAPGADHVDGAVPHDHDSVRYRSAAVSGDDQSALEDGHPGRIALRHGAGGEERGGDEQSGDHRHALHAGRATVLGAWRGPRCCPAPGPARPRGRGSTPGHHSPGS